MNRRHFFRQTALLGTGLTTLPGMLTSSLAAEPDKENPTATPENPFLSELYGEAQQEFTFRPDYPGGFSAWQKAARPRLQQLLGLPAIKKYAAQHEVKVTLEEPESRGSHTLQRGTIETEPHVTLPFYVLRPPGQGPFPLGLFPHGHDRAGHHTSAGVYADDKQRQHALEEDRDVAVQAVERGILAIAPAMRGMNAEALVAPDVVGRHGQRDCRSQQMHALLAGRTAVGERVWDLSRIIDWATANYKVDTRRILSMGNSGGGVVTLYAAACEPRITVAVPSCSFSLLASRTGHIYHCDCCAIPGIFRWGNLYDVAGLAAPRHFLAVNGLHDSLHNNDDIRHSARRAAAIFAAAGVPDHFAHRFGDAGHRFYKALMWPFVEQAFKADIEG